MATKRERFLKISRIKTCPIHGLMAGNNLQISSRGYAECRQCRLASSRKYNQKHREARAAHARIARAGKRTQYYRTWKERNRHKAAAHWAVKRALKSGLLIRPSTCQKCERACKPQAHHPDYNKRLEVIWLCVVCHRAIHRIDFLQGIQPELGRQEHTPEEITELLCEAQ